MQNMREFFKKLNNPITYGIAFVVIGLAFILLPDMILDITITVIGALIFIFGLLNIIFIGREATAHPIVAILGGGTILIGIMQIIFGVSLMIVRSAVGGTVCDVLGVLIMLYAGFKLFKISLKSAYHGRNYRIELTLYSLLLAIGLFVLIFPLYPHITAGGALIAVGAKLLADAIATKYDKNGKSEAPGSAENREKLNTGDYYTNDFVDKSDK